MRMRLIDWAFAAASGAFIVLMMMFVDNDDPWWVVIAGIGFVASIAMIRIQPTNVNDGLIVRVSALDVFTFVDGRPVEWCGNKHLHNIHAWFPTHELVDETGDIWGTRDDPQSVCLGHECHLPEAHMQRIGHE